MRFSCRCLNVNISVLKLSDEQEAWTDFVPVELVQYVNNPDEWFVGHLANEESIQIGWQSLAQTIAVRELKLVRCTNCQFYTHIVNFASNQILINRDLLDQTSAQSVTTDPHYSSISKILLPTSVNYSNVARFSNGQDECQQHDCQVAQQIYRQTLQELEDEYEEKIQAFQREQENLLAAKTKKINQELSLLLNLMRSVPRHPPMTKSPPTSSSYINENSTESGFGSDIFDIGTTESSRAAPQTDRGFAERGANSDDDDDDEDEINDDPMLDNRGWSTENSNPSNFATSLPRTIAFRPSSAHVISQQNDRTDDLERIGQSFRDLSRSMCTDGTEVFGELPSPRLNTQHT